MAKEITLAAVGDIMLGDSPQVFGFGVGSQIRRNGPLHPFLHVREHLRSADITIGNLEVVISRVDHAESTFPDQVYRAQPESVDGLVAAGFDVISVCTNHMMQHGQAPFEEAVGLLTEKGIEVIGAESLPLSLFNSSILDRGGLRFGFLGYNFRPQQYFVAPPAWPTPDFELIRTEVGKLREKADIVIVTLHWGDEFIDRPAPQQVELAHRLVDAGVDVILGHHPHILQGVERYEGAVIAYSLGNFVYDQWQERLRRSMILRLVIRGPRDIECRTEPILINDRYQPVPLEGEDGQRALARIAGLGECIGVDSALSYERQLEANLRRFRREIYVHYLTQFWRFKPRHFLANVAEIVKRRI